ncbi:MAG TPA: anti-sigma factor [Stellaceae bacterium]|jgi:anti-sigma-K factor RskA|nr:anti-sigma factor [Stellaceae bacterium]
MNYDSPELREQLAAEYVLGTMPLLVRRRFERLLADDPELRRAVEDWNARFDPIDYGATVLEPPARVWRAVERELALPRASAAQAGWLGSLAFWRGATLAAAALAAAAVVYVGVRPTPAPPSVVAILSDDKGEPGWIATRSGRGGDVDIAPIRQVALDATHAFELWAIADGKPHALGLLTPEPGHSLAVQAALVPEHGVLAVSLEPAGGSPTGLPTGPVEYKGAVLQRE